MRRALAIVAALALLPAIAEAQDGRRGQDRDTQAGPQSTEQAPAPQENRRTAPRGIGRPGGAFNQNPAQPAPPPPNAAPRGPQAGGPQAGGRNLAEDRDGRDGRDGRNAPDVRDRGFERGPDVRDRREAGRGPDFRGRAFSFRGRQYAAVRGPAFAYPRGWGYRHWARGEFLPGFFLAAPYFIDYAYLGLPPPPPGYRWVRYGPDALLVNIYNDRILDVIYDAFY